MISSALSEKLDEFQQAILYISGLLDEKTLTEMEAEYGRLGADINNINDLVRIGLPNAICDSSPIVRICIQEILPSNKRQRTLIPWKE